MYFYSFPFNYYKFQIKKISDNMGIVQKISKIFILFSEFYLDVYQLEQFFVLSTELFLAIIGKFLQKLRIANVKCNCIFRSTFFKHELQFRKPQELHRIQLIHQILTYLENFISLRTPFEVQIIFLLDLFYSLLLLFFL